MEFLYVIYILACLLCIGRIVVLVNEIEQLRREQMEFHAKCNIKKTCENCICSRVSYGFRTGWKYMYCMLDEPSTWIGGKEVSPNHTCKYWRNTK